MLDQCEQIGQTHQHRAVGVATIVRCCGSKVLQLIDSEMAEKDIFFLEKIDLKYLPFFPSFVQSLTPFMLILFFSRSLAFIKVSIIMS